MFKQNLEKIGYPQLEQEVLKFWQENKIFEKVFQLVMKINPGHFMKALPQQMESPAFIMLWQEL